MADPRTPVVFVHGLWLHSTSSKGWLDLFARPATTRWHRAGRGAQHCRGGTPHAGQRGRVGHAVTELVEVVRGHSLTIDSGWREVAATCLAWLGGQGVGPGASAAAS